MNRLLFVLFALVCIVAPAHSQGIIRGGRAVVPSTGGTGSTDTTGGVRVTHPAIPGLANLFGYAVLADASGNLSVGPVNLVDSLIRTGPLTIDRTPDLLTRETDSIEYMVLEQFIPPRGALWGGQSTGYVVYYFKLNLKGAFSAAAHLCGIRISADSANGVVLDAIDYELYGRVDTSASGASGRASHIIYSWGSPATFPGTWGATSALNNAGNAGVGAIPEPYSNSSAYHFLFFHSKNNGTLGWGVMKVNYFIHAGQYSANPLRLSQTN